MFLKTFDEKECCGCTACSNVCPKNIIKMKEHKDGFMFPTIIDKDKCINCGLCEQVCPMMNFQKTDSRPLCFYGWHKNYEIRNKSTSGGAFSAIASMCIDLKFDIVYGATYADDWSIIHKGVPMVDYECLIGTKYVQSDMCNCIRQIRLRLKEGKKVLFVGTPCQVESVLLSNKRQENLLTVSIVCHNTASPAAYMKYCQEMSGTKKVLRIVFRDKVILNGGKGITSIVYSDGQKVNDLHNVYTTVFGLGLMCRKSCEVCPFTTVYRNSDFTIGDFWGLADKRQDLTDESNKGVSLLLTHSVKAKRMIPYIKKYFEMVEVPLEYVLNEKQPQLMYPVGVNLRRDKFLKKVLVDDASFIKTAKYEINLWKMKKRIERFLHIKL